MNIDDTRERLTSSSTLVAVLAGGLAAAIFSGQIVLPRWAMDVLIASVAIGPAGYLGGGKIAEWLSDGPSAVNAMEVDAYRDGMVHGDPVRVPPEIWDDAEIVDGQPYPAESGAADYFVRELDWDAENEKLQITGVWMGEMSDVEVMSKKEAIRANRGQLRHWARIGQGLYAKIPSLIQAIESGYWQYLSDETMDATTSEPEVVRSQVTADVEELVESIEPPEPPQVEEDYDDLEDADIDDEPENGGDGE
ncbi:hypothetical protein [Haloarcula rubripromontorii]|uniref:hypothetical protein n=1 Tax=Haloarcula rubripromontorii TaxID=1705562 RepID=UPI00345B9F5D